MNKGKCFTLDSMWVQLLPSPAKSGTHIATAGYAGVMQLKFVAQGNAIASVTSHSPMITDGSIGTM